MLTKRYLLLRDMFRRLNTKQKLHKFKKKMPSITGLVTIDALNLKATGIENKIPDIINVATKLALKTKVTNVENKVSDTASFVTTEYNKLIKTSFDAKVKEAVKSFINKSQVDNSLDTAKKYRKNKYPQKFDLPYFVGKSYFSNDRSQSHLIFQFI